MPLITDTPKTPPVQKPVPVKVTSDEFKGVAVDTRYEPASALLTHIEGASWTVTYYSQILGSDNALSGQNLNRSAANQQYHKVNNFELKVTSPLQYSQDTQTKQQTITGQAQLYPNGIIPNEGDNFLATIADGRETLFVIKQTERRSFYKEAAFVIDYEVVDYAEKDNRLADLTIKTVQESHYVRDRSLHGEHPLISTNEKHQISQLQGYMEELRDYYFTRFFSREFGTLVMPGQEYPIYDPFLTKAVLAMFRDEPHPNVKNIRDLNVGEDDNYLLPSVWSALLKKRRRDLKVGVMDQIGLVTARGFARDPMMDSIAFSGVRYVVYPKGQKKSEDYLRKDYSKPLADFDIRLTETSLVDLFELLSVTALYGINREHLGNPLKQVKAVNPITHDSYIFSDAFYRNAQEGQSALELLLQQYLDGEAMHLPALTILSGSYTSWGALEQYYQLPFVMAMIRAAIRRI